MGRPNQSDVVVSVRVRNTEVKSKDDEDETKRSSEAETDPREIPIAVESISTDHRFAFHRHGSSSSPGQLVSILNSSPS